MTVVQFQRKKEKEKELRISIVARKVGNPS